MLAVHLVALSLLARAVFGLQCRCSVPGPRCADNVCVVSTERNGACLSYSLTSASGARIVHMCSEAGVECSGPRARCCQDSDFCNAKPPSTLPQTSPTTQSDRRNDDHLMTEPWKLRPELFIPPSQGKLRCDCRNWTLCKQDGGNRGEQHCKVHNGWCVSEAKRDGPDSPIQYSYFCTTLRAVCSLSNRPGNINYNIACCSDRKFCNEGVQPELPESRDHIRLNTVTLSIPEMKITAGLPITETTSKAFDSPSPNRIWCHCSGSDTCKERTSCQTDGACFSRQMAGSRRRGILDMLGGDVQICLNSSAAVVCQSRQGSCCRTDCCNGFGSCVPEQTAKFSPTVTTVTQTGEASIPVTTKPRTPRQQCRCSKCLNRTCMTHGVCVVDVHVTTRKSLHYCLEGTGHIAFRCMPSLVANTRRNATRWTVVNQTHRFCCLGDNCNIVHPQWREATEQRYLHCHCTNSDSVACTQRVCTVPASGACYRNTVTGSGCFVPLESEHRCMNGTVCCQTDHCNAEQESSTIKHQSSTFANDHFVKNTPRKNSSHTAITIAAASACVLILVTVFLVVVAVHRVKGSQQPPLSKQPLDHKNNQVFGSETSPFKQAKRNGQCTDSSLEQHTCTAVCERALSSRDGNPSIVSPDKSSAVELTLEPQEVPDKDTSLDHIASTLSKFQSRPSLLKVSNL